jgi:phage-related protein
MRFGLSAKKALPESFFTTRSEEIVILHGFVKKTDKTPRREMDTARRRLKEIGDENA